MPPRHKPRRGESPTREPLASTSSRSKCTFPIVNTPVMRRPRHNSENMPPDSALNFKTTSPFSETNVSPALSKSSSKSKQNGHLSLPPRPPTSRPSPATLPKASGNSGNQQEPQGHAKRKLNLEGPIQSEPAIGPQHEQDTGVKVIIRMRPCNQREISDEATQIVEKLSCDSLCMGDQHFTYDHVAGLDASQQVMFEMVGLPLVENCLQGFNSSIFAYGQTGSGKTYTMWGATQDLMAAQPPSEERGLTPRVFERLFHRIKEEETKSADKQLHYQCRCSFLEIYNEQITDLLEPLQKALQVREDTKTGVYVENLTEEYVSSTEDVFHLMAKGLGNRKVGSTSMNLESSRSHTLFTCVIESRCKSISDGVSSVRTSRMNLVDLAGSERQKLTGAAGERLKEAGNINRSLSQLGNLINILAEISQTGKPRHIPYRDSRLTFLLQESLGGNAKLAMICAISPASSCKSETLSTLRFAQRAKAIKNKAVVNEETENDVNILREQIRQLKDELMRMKSNGNQPGGVGSYSTTWNARRSYNLLRMSLSRPLTLPHTDTDTDEEMEIDEDTVESLDGLNGSTSEDESTQKDLQFFFKDKASLANGKLKTSQNQPQGFNNCSDRAENFSIAEDTSVVLKEVAMDAPVVNVFKEEHPLRFTKELNDLTEDNDSTDNAISKPSCMKGDDSADNTLIVSMESAMDIAVEANAFKDVSSCMEGDDSAEDTLNLSMEVAMDIAVEANASNEVSNKCSERAEDMLIVAREVAVNVAAVENASKEAYPSEFTKHLDKLTMDNDSKDNAITELSCMEAVDMADITSIVLEEVAQDVPVVENASKEVNNCSNSIEDTLMDVAVRDIDSRGVDFLELDNPVLDKDSKDSNISKPSCMEVEGRADGTLIVSKEVGLDVVVEENVSKETDPLELTNKELSELTVDNDSKHNAISQPSCAEADEQLNNAGGEEVGPLFTEEVIELTVESDSKDDAIRTPSCTEADKRMINAGVKDVDSLEFTTELNEATVDNQIKDIAISKPSCVGAVEQLNDTGHAVVCTSDTTSVTGLCKGITNETDRLAASLHRGLQILENHQKKVVNTRASVVRFSFQNLEIDKLKSRDLVDRSMQTSPVGSPEQALVPMSEPKGSDSTPIRALQAAEPCDTSPWAIVPSDDPKTPTTKPETISQKVEAVLAGAMRRERSMEEALNRKNAEIEQLNRLVRQYKHERECNAVLQQSLEEKIVRLESLMDGTMPTDAFLNEEWSSLQIEHEILQKKYDHHPEVTLANIRQQRLCDDLEQYRNFCDLGERETLLIEVSQLRNQLQYYVDSGTPRPAKHRKSLTPQANKLLFDPIIEASTHNGAIAPLDASSSTHAPEKESCTKCDELQAQWGEQENEWISVLEEMRQKVEDYKLLAQKRSQEFEGERRCADEMKEALEIAMQGHARLLDQYAELQEKHIALLAKHRKIRDAMSDARKKAGKLGFLGKKWFEAQAAEVVALKLEHEHERKVAKEQIEGLQAQVRDTADAVQAAGELLVRLKEAEEAVQIAQDAAAHAEHDVDKLHREMEKLKRRHSTEMATMQQRLLEARLQRSTVCPMCAMAERVKFQFVDVDAEEAEAALEAEHLAAVVAKEEEAASYLAEPNPSSPFPFYRDRDAAGRLSMLREEDGDDEVLHLDEPLPQYDDVDCEFNFGHSHALEMDDRWYDDVQQCNL